MEETNNNRNTTEVVPGLLLQNQNVKDQRAAAIVHSGRIGNGPKHFSDIQKKLEEVLVLIHSRQTNLEILIEIRLL